MSNETTGSTLISVLTLVALLVLSTVTISVRASAQVAGATLSGTVTDPSGAAIPNASVSIKNTATGVAHNVTTNGAGLYSAPNLIPGPYEVTISAHGFSTLVRSGVTLAVGQTLQLNLTLKVGAVTQQVQVTGEPPMIQTATSSIRAQVGGTTVRQLPLNGRDWTSLAALQAGVTVVQAQQSLTASGAPRVNRGFGNQMTVSGARPQENNYRLDGISINDYANGGPGSVLGGNLGVDAIQEFSVLTSNYDASYGRAAGGIINAITRSGTNQFHGDAYDFLRNSALDSRSFFDVGKPSFRRNQFGASAGGPIQKDKTFIFGDYEGIRQFEGITQVDTVPSAAARAGNLSSGAVTVSPLVTPFFGFYPLPNGGLVGKGDTGIFSFPSNQITAENFFTTRIDRQFSANDSLSGTYMYDNSNFSQPDSLDTTLVDSRVGREALILQESHTFSPSFVNVVRFGYSRQNALGNQNLTAILPLATSTALGFIPGRAAGYINVPGLTLYTGGVGSANAPHYFWNSFQFYDDAFKTAGIHSLKFGASVERMQMNILNSSRPNGQFGFGSLAAFLTDQPTNAKGDIPGTLTERGVRQTLFGAYLQDDVRVKPNLTANLGVRYEMTTVPTEVQNKLSALTTLTAAQPHLGNPYLQNPTLRDFAPRVGFAWDPFRSGKTALRGGFGVYDDLPLPYLFALPASLTAPFFEDGSVGHLPPGAFPIAWFASISSNPKSFRTAYIEQNPPRSYVMQYTMNLQRQIAPNLIVTASYIGTHGVHMPFRSDDFNMVLPSLAPQGYLWPSPRGSGTELNPNTGQDSGLIWDSSSFYNSLQLQVVRQFSRGFQIQGTYTWSRCLDTGSTSLVADAFSNSLNGLLWFDNAERLGPCDYNIPQNLVVNSVWDVPGYQGGNKLLRGVARGWELGGILTAQSGSPFTPVVGGDPLGQNNTVPLDFPNRLGGSGCQSLTTGNILNYVKTQCLAFPSPSTLLGNLARNSLAGPFYTDLDFSVFKNNHVRLLGENTNIQIRFESFNVLNRPNFLAPLDNSTAFSQAGAPVPAFGRIDALINPGREIQAAVKVTW